MQAEMHARLMAVLVVYERNLEDVKPWPMLRAWVEDARDPRPGLKLERILIYDNSRRPRARVPADVKGCEYLHNPDNGGIAAAYESALAIAGTLGIEWLLL